VSGARAAVQLARRAALPLRAAPPLFRRAAAPRAAPRRALQRARLCYRATAAPARALCARRPVISRGAAAVAVRSRGCLLAARRPARRRL
jgi:hypothetical protein